ncbi:hypothetical protein FQA39_LY13700 [Lamprigera yunnana]|nr:hypothetical protein FQA39_LY13700 [Lamprigera yunnana]
MDVYRLGFDLERKFGADSFKANIDHEISICFLKVNELRDKLGNAQEFSESVALRIEARLHHIIGRINKLELVAANNLVVSSKIKDLLGYVEEFEELFDVKRSVITKGRHEPGLETEQEDAAEINRVNTHGNIPRYLVVTESCIVFHEYVMK